MGRPAHSLRDSTQRPHSCLPCAHPTLPSPPNRKAHPPLSRGSGGVHNTLPPCAEVKSSPAGQYRIQRTERLLNPSLSLLQHPPCPESIQPTGLFLLDHRMGSSLPSCLQPPSLLPGKAFCHVQCPAPKSSVPSASCPSQGKSYPGRMPHLLIWTPPATLVPCPPSLWTPCPAPATRPQQAARSSGSPKPVSC